MRSPDLNYGKMIVKARVVSIFLVFIYDIKYNTTLCSIDFQIQDSFIRVLLSRNYYENYRYVTICSSNRVHLVPAQLVSSEHHSVATTVVLVVCEFGIIVSIARFFRELLDLYNLYFTSSCLSVNHKLCYFKYKIYNISIHE
jgi:hypothetical protein